MSRKPIWTFLFALIPINIVIGLICYLFTFPVIEQTPDSRIYTTPIATTIAACLFSLSLACVPALCFWKVFQKWKHKQFLYRQVASENIQLLTGIEQRNWREIRQYYFYYGPFVLTFLITTTTLLLMLIPIWICQFVHDKFVLTQAGFTRITDRFVWTATESVFYRDFPVLEHVHYQVMIASDSRLSRTHLTRTIPDDELIFIGVSGSKYRIELRTILAKQVSPEIISDYKTSGVGEYRYKVIGVP